jgi:hypothetical protein
VIGKMWSFLRAIPPDVCGANILTFLNYQSIVKLDVAIKIDSQRRIYWRMLAHAGPVMLSGKARQLPKVWQWFWCRKATIDSIDLVLERTSSTEHTVDSTAPFSHRLRRQH